MWSALKNILGTRSANHSGKPTEASLFSGFAYFSNRVPKAFAEKWVTHGGDISSGTTLDVRARYFFATDPSEPWVTKLFAKSVIVIHAGWIVHSVDQAFQVPIAEYILDDKFMPGPPYKLPDIALPTYVPLAEPDGPTDSESSESGPLQAQVSDTPSTPIRMRRKRKREQAYFDSPSRSLVFSGFDKDGIPRRPRKQRKLRFDPSFSPEGGRSSKEAGLDWFRDHCDILRNGDEFSGELCQCSEAAARCGPSQMITGRSPDTPDKPIANGAPSATYRRLSLDEQPSKPTCASLPAVSTDTQEKELPVRTIDFTNLPPPTRRWRFPQADATNSGNVGMKLSVAKPTDQRIKTPKKISFANQAKVCVYMVSPRQPNAKDDMSVGCAQQCLGDVFGDGAKMNVKIGVSSDEVEGSDDLAPKAINDLVPRSDSLEIDSVPTRLLGGDQSENETLTLTMEEVRAMRRRLLDLATRNGVDDPQLAVLFELGKTFRGMAFRHVW